MDFPCFRAIQLDSIHEQPVSSQLKLYGRISGCLKNDPCLLVVEDVTCKLLLDTSAFETTLYDKGEWYRLLVEYRGMSDESVPALPLLKLLVPLRRVEGYDKDQHWRMMSLRNDFISQFDSLVAYASKNTSYIAIIDFTTLLRNGGVGASPDSFRLD